MQFSDIFVILLSKLKMAIGQLQETLLCDFSQYLGYCFNECVPFCSLFMTDIRKKRRENNQIKPQIIDERGFSTSSPAADHLWSLSRFFGPRLSKRAFCANRPTDPSKIVLGDGTKRQTILVTGGAGFLGQHIVRLLEENAENVEEIRIFDSRPYRNSLGRPTWCNISLGL